MARSGDGSFYEVAGAVVRITGPAPAAVVSPFARAAGDNVTANNQVSSSSSGNLVWKSNYSTGGSGLYITSNGTNTEILRSNTTTSPTTLAGLGRVTDSLGTFAIDDRGRVLAGFNVESGVYMAGVWDGKWTP